MAERPLFIWNTATKILKKTKTQADRQRQVRRWKIDTNRDSCSMRSWCRCARPDKHGRR